MKITHTIEGKGSDVILLHGFPSNMYLWDEIKEELIKKNKRVTVPEQRGYPLSVIPDSLVSDFNIESLAMDIDAVNDINPLNLEAMLNDLDGPHTAHDVFGIAANFDRKTLTLQNGWTPRFTKGPQFN